MEVREKRVMKLKREGDRFGLSLGMRLTGALAWLIHTDPRLDPRHTLQYTGGAGYIRGSCFFSLFRD